MSSVVYASNGAKVGDGMRITRVSNDGSTFEVWTGKAFSEVVLKGATSPEPEPAPGNALLTESGEPIAKED